MPTIIVIKRYLRSKGILLIFFCLLFNTIEAQQKPDRLAGNADDKSARMQALQNLRDSALSYRDKPEEIACLKQFLEEATALNAKQFMYEALSNLSRYYYNRTQSDSLMHWARLTDSLVLVNNDNPDAYYDIHSMVSKSLYDQDYDELSIDEVYKMQDKAIKTQQLYGRICSSEALGKLYLYGGQDSLAIVSFQEAINLLT